MPGGTVYSKDVVLKIFDELLKKFPDVLYNNSCINNTNKMYDTEIYLSEYFSELLFERIDFLEGIKPIDRNKAYKKNLVTVNKHLKGKGENNFAKSLIGEQLPHIGIVMDYQIPISESRGEGVGRIDLLSYNKTTKKCHLIELKYRISKNTLLRAGLEIYTYFKQVNHEKLLEEFRHHRNLPLKNLKLVPTILLYEGSNPAKEAEEMKQGKRPKIKQLFEALGIEVYTFNFKVESMLN